MAVTRAARTSPRKAGRGSPARAAQAHAAQAVAVRRKAAPGRLRAIDVVSFDRYEPMILAALVPGEFFRHDAMIGRYGAAAIGPALARGTHFYDEMLPWNSGTLDDGRGRLAPAERLRRATAAKLAA